MKGIRMIGKEQEISQEMQVLFDEWKNDSKNLFTGREAKLIRLHPHFSINPGEIQVIDAVTAEAPTTNPDDPGFRSDHEQDDFSGTDNKND